MNVLFRPALYAFFAPAFLIAGCASTPLGPTELRVEREDDQVSGVAGADWTDDELRDNAFNAICQRSGESLVSFRLTRSDSGVASFSGRCIRS